MFSYIYYEKQLNTHIVYGTKPCMHFSLLNSVILNMQSAQAAETKSIYFSFSRTNPVQYKTGVQTHAEEETLRKLSANRSLLFY